MRDDFWIKYKRAAADTISADHFFKAENALTGLNGAFDDPVDAAARENLFFAFWPHAGDVIGQAVWMRCGAGLLPRKEGVD